MHVSWQRAIHDISWSDAVLILLLGLLMAGKDFKADTRLKYQAVPEKDGPFVGATDLALDRDGNLYILDVDARKVFCWDHKGNFTHSFGRAGNGPGEFAFDPNYRYFFNLTVTRDRLAISNTNTKTLSYFTLDGRFIQDKSIPGQGAIRRLEADKNDNLLIIRFNYFQSSLPTQELQLYSPDLQFLKRISTLKSQSHVPRFTNGNLRGYRLNAFLADMYLFTDAHFDGMILGTSRGPNFDIYDKNGNMVRTVHLEVPRLEIPARFLEEFKNSIKERRDIVEVVYPDKMPYYHVILPVKNLGYFLALISDETAIYMGFMVDPQGKNLGRFSVTCGEMGLLESLDGRLLQVETGESEQPIIRELVPVR